MIFILSVVISFFVFAKSAHAQNQLTYTQLATHPQATAQSSSFGKTLHKLEVQGDNIYAGYGDYGDNTGPIELNPFNIATKEFTGSLLQVSTEQISQIRSINDKLYAPTIDPHGCYNCAAGFAVGPPWSSVANVDALHIFDVATLTNNDLWMVGSADVAGGSATLWHSTDDGANWQIAKAESGNGANRYYWVATLNNKLYVQDGGFPGSPVRIFDGNSWTDGTTDQISPPDGRVVVFDNHIVSTQDGLSAFDGNSVTKLNSYTESGDVQDMYVADGYLYVTNGTSLVRTADLVTWQNLGSVPDGTSSIAVVNDHVYIGDTNSSISESDQAISELFGSPDSAQDSDGDGVSDTVEAAGPNNGDGNYDNVQDSTQPTVTSLPNPLLGGVYTTIVASGACNTLQAVAMTTPGNIGAVAAWSYRLQCSESGQSGSVTIWIDHDYSSAKLKALKDVAGTYTDISNRVALATITQNTKRITKASMELTDGGSLDQDGLANGTIIDPLVIALDNSGAAASGQLASTGNDTISIALIGISSLSLGLYMLTRLLRTSDRT